ncbi:hypothetical protein R2R70_23485, partial [Cobetia sp. SIMBA_158]|uniref:hypothetical protein n=1 Tax=Cobetia sp. SIMBA_158 TaxID=3081617 RepID=UPI0039802445
KLLLWRCHGILRERRAITLKAFIHHLAALADLLVTAGDPRLALLDLTIALLDQRLAPGDIGFAIIDQTHTTDDLPPT